MNPRVSRRGFLGGLVAAPTIIGIDRRMKFFTPPRLIVPRGLAAIHPTQLIVPPELYDQVRNMLDPERFRWLIEPKLRELFDGVYVPADQEIA